MQRWPVIISTALLISGMETACSQQATGPAPAPPPTNTPSTTRAAPVFDPPLAFAENGVEIATVPKASPYTRQYDLTYQVHNMVVYFALGDKLEGRDIATGSAVWSQSVSDYGEPLPVAPAIAQGGGRVQLFLTFLKTVPGSGTTQDRLVRQVASFDASNGDLVWIREIVDIPESRMRGNPLGVVGANENHVVVSGVQVVGDQDVPPVTVVLDAKTGVVRWQNPDVWSFALSGDVVAGTFVEEGDRTIVGLAGRSAMDGGERWRNVESFRDEGVRNGRAMDAGLFIVSRGLDTLVVDIDTGRVILEFRYDVGPLDFVNFQECYFDGKETIVCAGSYAGGSSSPHRVGGFDRQTGQRLWELPDKAANRIAPKVTTVRNGVVYADGVTLDARTGQDKTADLKIVPDRVVPGFCLRYDGSTLWAHPATK